MPETAETAGQTANFPAQKPISGFAPGGQIWEAGQWQNQDAAGTLQLLQTSTDLEARRGHFRKMLSIVEREDPAYVLLHQNGTFTGKRRDIAWKASGSFTVDFRAQNWG